MSVSFDFKRRLGSGYFGEVWLATETGLGDEIALKCIPPDKIINQNNFFQEAQALKASEHVNIVHVNDTGRLSDGRIYVSMEYLQKGSVEDEAQGAPLPLTRAKRIMVDLLRGLNHAHGQGIVHRDIKPANILVGDFGEAKLSDFGLALPNIRGLDLARIKKYQYVLHLAPEVRRIQDYTVLSDIYACGVTFYRLINGDSNLPQVPPSQAQDMARLGEFPNRDAYRDFIPRGLRMLINRAMSVNPADRYCSAEEMRRALERQPICIDWEESQGLERTIWVGRSQSGLFYEVMKLRHRERDWAVETRKGALPTAMRHVGRLSFTNLRRQDAGKKARRILQDLTIGKKISSP